MLAVKANYIRRQVRALMRCALWGIMITMIIMIIMIRMIIMTPDVP